MHQHALAGAADQSRGNALLRRTEILAACAIRVSTGNIARIACAQGSTRGSSPTTWQAHAMEDYVIPATACVRSASQGRTVRGRNPVSSRSVLSRRATVCHAVGTVSVRPRLAYASATRPGQVISATRRPVLVPYLGSYTLHLTITFAREGERAMPARASVSASPPSKAPAVSSQDALMIALGTENVIPAKEPADVWHHTQDQLVRCEGAPAVAVGTVLAIDFLVDAHAKMAS